MAGKEGLTTEQVRAIWDGVNQEAKRCVAYNLLRQEDDPFIDSFIKEHGNLGVRLARPQVIQTNDLEVWQTDPKLVDASGHLISRILMVGFGEKEVREGKIQTYLRTGSHDNRLLTLTWNDQELGNLVLYQPRTNDHWSMELTEGNVVEVAQGSVLFTEVLLPKPDNSLRGVVMPAALPAGFKEVFNHKTGMMIERP